MSDLGSRLKASRIPFYPSWEAEIGRSPHFDHNVAAEILPPVFGGSVSLMGVCCSLRKDLVCGLQKNLKGSGDILKRK